ncbi:unnamed protein product [Durusdinium trenchii]|uniref:Uncharacterized protein n=1 Tax=Durusdinium trenchii TaxID=1381693 RepID=A0ABP0R948_9DINO
MTKSERQDSRFGTPEGPGVLVQVLPRKRNLLDSRNLQVKTELFIIVPIHLGLCKFRQALQVGKPHFKSSCMLVKGRSACCIHCASHVPATGCGIIRTPEQSGCASGSALRRFLIVRSAGSATHVDIEPGSPQGHNMKVKELSLQMTPSHRGSPRPAWSFCVVILSEVEQNPESAQPKSASNI